MRRLARDGKAGVLVLALLMAMTACGGGDASSGSEAGQQPWLDPDATWMQPPGTPIFAGLVVPRESQLIGPVVSRLNDTNKPPHVTSQRAYLLIDGDIDDVAADLVRQWPRPDTFEQYRRDQCRDDRDLGERRCEFTLVIKPADEEAGFLGRSIEVVLWQDLSDDNVRGQGTIGLATPPTTLPDALPEATEGVSGPQSVASNVDYLPDLEIVPGSFLAGPAFPGSITGGYEALIGVTADPDEVFDAYVAQDEDKPYFTADETLDGIRIREYASAEAGGIWLDITLQEKDGNAWIRVSAQND